MPTILLLSDIHGNLSALDAVLNDVGSRGVAFDAVWVLGDVVGYGAEPDGVVERLREVPNLAMVKGNHEAAALGEISLATFNPYAAAAAAWTARVLSDETRRFLRELPIRLVEDEVTLCHGTPRDPVWEYMFSVETARASVSYLDTSGCVHGHTHLPTVFGQQHSGRWSATLASDSETVELDFVHWFVNPGSVGQPRDGDWRASYALLHLHPSELPAVEYHRVEYDVSHAQDLILAAGLQPSLAFRLSTGR